MVDTHNRTIGNKIKNRQAFHFFFCAEFISVGPVPIRRHRTRSVPSWKLRRGQKGQESPRLVVPGIVLASPFSVDTFPKSDESQCGWVARTPRRVIRRRINPRFRVDRERHRGTRRLSIPGRGSQCQRNSNESTRRRSCLFY